MRLAYLVSKYPSENHTYILREVAGLRALGFDLDVAAISPDDRPAADVSPAELGERRATYVVKARGALGLLTDNAAVALRRPAGYVRGIRLARRLAGADLRRLAYNLVYLAEAASVGRWMARRGHARLHVHYASTVGLLAAEVFGVAVSATIHGSAEFINPDLQKLREKLATFRSVVTISRYGRSQMMLNSDPADWGKIDVVPLGVDPGEFAAGPPDAGPPGAGGVAEGAGFRISCVGQLQPAKGVHVLLDAVALLAAQGRDVRVTLVGDGPSAASLDRHARALGVRGRVDFAGRLGQAGVRRVYAGSDAFVLASFAEGVPVVLMEAMASGVPCVATRITGVPELVRDGLEGLLVTPSDAEELAAAVARLMDDPALRARLAEAGRRRVAEHYGLEANVGRLGEVLRRRHAAEA